MALFNADFTWSPAQDATGYRLTVNGALLVDQTAVGYQTQIELANGEHVFTLTPHNAFGDGPVSTIVRSTAAVPGPVTGFDVTLSAV